MNTIDYFISIFLVDDEVTRGCLKDLNAADRQRCDNEKDLFCSVCFGFGCNNGTASSGLQITINISTFVIIPLISKLIF